jgi:hypothetical protein
MILINPVVDTINLYQSNNKVIEVKFLFILSQYLSCQYPADFGCFSETLTNNKWLPEDDPGGQLHL